MLVFLPLQDDAVLVVRGRVLEEIVDASRGVVEARIRFDARGTARARLEGFLASLGQP